MFIKILYLDIIQTIITRMMKIKINDMCASLGRFAILLKLEVIKFVFVVDVPA